MFFCIQSMQTQRSGKYLWNCRRTGKANVVKSWKIRFFLCYTQAEGLSTPKKILKKKGSGWITMPEDGESGGQPRERYLYYVKYLPTLNWSITTQLEPRIQLQTTMLSGRHSGEFIIGWNSAFNGHVLRPISLNTLLTRWLLPIWSPVILKAFPSQVPSPIWHICNAK